MKRNGLFIIGAVLILLAAGIAQFLFPHTTVSPSSTASEPPTAELNTPASPEIKDTSVTPASHTVQTSFALAEGDSIASWNFTGAYTGNPELVAKAQTEITRISELIGKNTYPDVTLYVGIANQYELLGDGKKQYEYLGRAITADPTSGLPWHNLGVLMERLSAFQTARIAYERAALLQPQLKQWHYAYFVFLIMRMKDDTTDIEKEFASAIKNLGQDSDILQLYSEWKNS